MNGQSDDEKRGQHDEQHQVEGEHGRTKFHYFVDGEKYETEQPTVTGAYIKSLLPNFDPSYSLFLEGHGNDPDELIADTTTIPLDRGTKHFYTVPPATFGV